jgi:hypothetical protein
MYKKVCYFCLLDEHDKCSIKRLDKSCPCNICEISDKHIRDFRNTNTRYI